MKNSPSVLSTTLAACRARHSSLPAGMCFLPVLLFLLCALCWNPASGAGQGDWWMYRHDIQHTGRCLVAGPASANQQWATTVGSALPSSTSFAADGTIYLGASDGNLYALNPADGTQEWTFTTGGAITATPAVGADGTIYVGSNDHNLYAVNPDGSLQWVFPTGYDINSSPAIGADGTIYCGSGDYNLYAINPNGSPKWAFPTGNSVDSSPAIAGDGTIYIGSDDNNLYAINPLDGSQKWVFPTYGQLCNYSPVVATDGTIYAASNDTNLYAINPTDGSQKWAFSMGRTFGPTPAIATDGTIYAGSDDGNLYALNPADGSQKWSFLTGGAVEASPVIDANGVIYIGSFDTNLYAINPNGAEQWAQPFSGRVGLDCASPAIDANGTLYVSTDTGSLLALGAGTPVSSTYTVTASAGPGGTIAPNGAQTVTSGGSITFTATPNSSALSAVDTWSVDNIPVQYGGNSYTLSPVTADHTINVTFIAPQTVRALPVPAVYAPGIPFTVTINVTPSAAVLSYAVQETPPLGWTVSNISDAGLYNAAAGDIRWGPFTDSTTRSLTYTVTPPAAANGPQIFLGTASFNGYSFPVTGDSNLNAMTFTLTPQAIGNGTISPNVPTTMTYGSKLVFLAKPNAGYLVSGWTFDGLPWYNNQNPVNGAYTGTGFTVTPITANHTIAVTFSQSTFTVTASSDANCTINPSGAHSVANNGSIAFTTSTNPGYSISGWYLDGILVQSGGAGYTLSSVSANHTILVTSGMAHPADTNPNTGDQLWQITIDELTAYGAAWSQHQNWPIAPTQIPMDYVTRAGFIWNSGEDYQYDGTQAAPLCWYSPYILGAPFKSAAINRTMSSSTRYTASASSAVRSITPKVILAQPVTATVVVTPVASTTCYALEEVIPKGWNVSNSGGTFDAINSKVKWGPFFDNQVRTFTYTITPPSGAKGVVTLKGTASFNGANVSVVGDNTITVGYVCQPDLLIRNAADASYIGAGIIDQDGTNQTKSQTVLKGAMATYQFQVKNTGTTADTFLLVAAGAGSGWKVQYVDQQSGADITKAITSAGGWKTAMLAPGASLSYTLNVTPDNTVIVGATKTLQVQATSCMDGTKTDVVAAMTAVKAIYQPDLLVYATGDAAYIGGNIFNTTGAGQTRGLTITPNVAAVYYFHVLNAGNSTDTFTVKASAAASGWKMVYKDLTTTLNDITTAITSTVGWSSGPLAPGAYKFFSVQVTPDNTVMCSAVNTVMLTAVSTNDSTKQDMVKALTTASARYQPDLSIYVSGDSAYTGVNIFNTTGAGQTRGLTVNANVVATYYFHVQNSGNTTDTFTVKIPAGGSGWKVAYKDLTTTLADITTTITGATGWSSGPLAPGAYKFLAVQVTPDTTLASNTVNTQTISAVSTNDATKQDVVKALTTKK